MGSLDKSAKKLIKENAVFADAMNVFRYQGRKVIKPEYLKENEERFRSITLNARNVIESISSLKINSNGKGGYNMCEAIEGIKEDARKEGADENKKEMIAALKASGASDELIENALKYMEKNKRK